MWEEVQYMSSIVPFSTARGEKSTIRARRVWMWEEVDEFYKSIFYRQGRKEHHQSLESLDVHKLMSPIVQFSIAIGEKSATRAWRAWM
jgi:hypothetical protein